jgi:hypothetical protein
VSCKDCEVGTKRPTPHPGPRCVTHHRAELARRRAAARDKRIEETYGLTPADYDAIFAYQDGACAICRRATGKTRRLSVDHDHACCNGPRSCSRCVRGLLCRPCNRMLGHLRDEPRAFIRAAEYLDNWPSALARNVSAGVGSRWAARGSSAAGAKAKAKSRSKT